MSNTFSEVYIRKRFQRQENQWPPDHPKVIANLALIHFKGEKTQQEFIEISMHEDFVLHSCYVGVSKKISDIFSSPKKFILIEGAPGIGKTVLAKEIACCWANKEMLDGKKLFLLFIRDPDLHSIKCVKDLVHYLGNDYLSHDKVEVVADRLKKEEGSNVVFVIDGYDECPHDSSLKRFIDKLYKGDLLPKCMVVITSRPTASLVLHESADQVVKILGLSKNEQDKYVSESLKKLPAMKARLREYLRHHPVINSLMYVPLHLAVLLYLFKHNNFMLPETLTEMNEYFIIHTICRHLSEKVKKHKFIHIGKLTELPEPELYVIRRLSELAFKGIYNNQLIFTYKEIKQICPEVDEIPGAINGFGLLQTVECCYHKIAGKSASVNFLHLTMQEYLAAFHVSTLSNDEQSHLIYYMFQNNWFIFMWIMYIGIVGLQPSCFTDIANSKLSGPGSNKLAILFVFQCYLEGKDMNMIPTEIISAFGDGNIDLNNITLLPHDVMSLIVFMMNSPTKWKSLNLSKCSIGCKGISNFTKFFTDFKEKVSTIKYVNLSNNCLTSLWETDIDLEKGNTADIGLLSVEFLDLSCNWLNDTGTKELFSAINFSENLRTLIISENNISADATVIISECLKINRVLHKLDLCNNIIRDTGAKVLAEGIQVSKTLLELNISKNWISIDGIMGIVKACKTSNLHKLVCTHNDLSRDELTVINEYVIKEKAVKIFDASWNSIGSEHRRLAIKTKFHLLDIQQKLQSRNYYNNSSIQEELWHINIVTEYTTQMLQSCFKNYLNEHTVVSLQDVRMYDFEIKILSDCLKLNTTVIDLNLSSNSVLFIYESPYKLSGNGILCISECLKMNKTLSKMNLSGNQIIDAGVEFLVKAISFNTNTALQKFDVSHNIISDDGAAIFSNFLVINKTLIQINLSGNVITDEGAKRLAEAIEVNTTLQEANISENLISREGVMRILEACTKNKKLCKLVCTHNNISKSGLAVINEYISKKKALQIFDASWNSVNVSFGKLAIITTFHLLDLQQKLEPNDDRNRQVWKVDKITKQEYRIKFVHCCLEAEQIITLKGIGHYDYLLGIDIRDRKQNDDSQDISKTTDNFDIKILSDIIRMHDNLCELNVSNCKISDKDLQILAKAVEDNITLQSFSISNSKIGDNGVVFISDCLESNRTLCELNLSDNQITDSGVESLGKAIAVNTALQRLDISCNIISDGGIEFFCDYLQINESLIELNLSENKIGDEGLRRLGKAIQVNTTLQMLNVSKNWITNEGVMGIVEACKCNKTLSRLICTHNSLSKFGLAAIAKYIRDENALQIFDASWNSIVTNNGKLAIKTTFCSLDLLQKFQSRNYNTREELWYVHKVTGLDYRAQILHCCFEEYLNEQSVNLQDMQLNDFEVEILSDCLKLNCTLIDLNLSGCLQGCNITSLLTFINALEINAQSTLCKLNFSNNHISDAVVEAFINTTLQKLNLSHNDISDHGLLFMYDCLKINRTLRVLDLCRNNITSKGAKILAEAIQVNTTLQYLNISNNWINKEGIVRIVKACTKYRTLHTLVCTHNNFSKPGLAEVTEYIRKKNAVKIFWASWNGICTKYSSLAIITTFHSLDVKQKPQKELWFLNEIPNLECRREFLHCCLESEQAVDFQMNKMAEIEILSNCFQVNSTLIEINLSGNGITDIGVEKLAEAIKVNATLQILDISCNTIHSSGMIALSNCLKINSKLSKLNISENNINDERVKCLTEGIKANKALKELNISKNLISKEGVTEIVEACRKNEALQTLVSRYNNLSKPGLLAISEYIKKKNALQIFDTSWNSIVTKSNKLAIKTTLQLLDVNQSKLQSDVNVTDAQEELWHVDKIPREFLCCCLESELSVNLHSISITNNFEIICDCLKVNNTLSELILSNNIEAGKLLKAINKVNIRLQHLDLSQNSITDDGILAICDYLKKHKMLCHLNVSKNHITDEGAKRLAEAIAVNARLQELNICKNWIGEKGVMKIAESCSKNKKLHKLICTHNNLSRSRLIAINDFIRKMNAVQIFDTSWNSIGAKNGKLAIKTIYQLFDLKQKIQLDNNGNQKELWYLDEITDPKYKTEFLCCGLEECLNKETFSLENTKMTDFEIGILSDCIRTNCKLTELNLPNCFTDNTKAVSAICSCLKINGTLSLCKLNLSNNQINDGEVKVLAETLSVHATLQKLDLSHNIISDDGIFFISDFLESNKMLLELNLTKNRITDKGAKTLAEALQMNTTLCELNISDNMIGKSGLMGIVKACVKNKVHKLVCTHNNLSKSGLVHIVEFIRKQNAVQTFNTSWNSICTINGRLGIKTTLQVEEESQTDNNNVQYYNDLKGWDLLLLCCFEEYLNEPTINLQNIEMNDVEIEVFCGCLGINRVLIELNMSNCVKANLDTISAISHCLKVNEALRKLNLSNNHITDEGAKHLAEAIQVNRTLQMLNISKNVISREGIMRIIEAYAINRTGYKLVCTHNKLIKSDFVAISEYIKKEKVPQIFKSSWNSVCIKSGRLGVETTIETLQLGNNGVYKKLCYVDGITQAENCEDEFLQCCIEYSFMHTISLQNVLVKGYLIEVASFVCFPKLTELTLSNCRFNTPGLMVLCISTYLKINTTLNKLSLPSNQITNAEITTFSKAIAVNSTLKRLELSHNLISDVWVLADALKNNKSLQELNLCGNNITNEGATRFARAIQGNVTLLELNISKNRIGKEGVMRILQAFKTLHKLVCTHNNLSKSGLTVINEYIRNEKAVQIFNASWNSICTTNQKLAIKTTLQSLQSRNNTLEKELWYMDEITELNYRTQILQCCFEDSLDKQEVSLQDMIRNNFKFEIVSNCHDCLIKINDTAIELDLSNCVMISYWLTNNASRVTINTILQTLDLSYYLLCDDGILCVSYCLETNETLQVLNLAGNYFTDEGARKLSAAILRNRTLQQLNVSDNWISKEGVTSIVKACTKNHTLGKLVCRHNNLSESELLSIFQYTSKNHAVQIFDASCNSIHIDKTNKLAIKTTLYSLDIQQSENNSNGQQVSTQCYYSNFINFNGITESELKYNKEFLHCCFKEYLNEQVVSLQNIKMNEFEIEILSDCLKINTTLIELNLSDFLVSNDEYVTFNAVNGNTEISDALNNHITDGGFKVLMAAITTNVTLKKLDLSHSIVFDNGILFVIEYLKINKTLHELNLSRNKITDERVKMLAEAIQVNVTLQVLNISKNLISKEGVMSIVEACEVMKMLHTLVCTHNNLSKPGLAKINGYISQKQETVKLFDASWNSVGTKFGKLVIKTTFQLLDVHQSKSQIQGGNIKIQEVWCANEIVKLEQRREFLYCCFESKQTVNLQGIGVTEGLEIELISDCLSKNDTLKELTLSKIKLSDKETEDLAKAIKANETLQSFDISHNIITDNGISFISNSLAHNGTLYKLNLSNNSITDEGAKELAKAIKVNAILKELNISKNLISKKGIMKILKACTKNSTLFKIVCNYNNLSKLGFEDVLDYIRNEDAVQLFDSSWNSVGIKYGRLVIMTTFCVLENLKLQDNHDLIQKELWFVNEITQLKYRREFLSCCFESEQIIDLQGIMMVDNFEIEALSDCLKMNNLLVELNLSNIGIKDEGAEKLAEVIKENTTLQNLDISCNTIYSDGIKAISECLKANKTLRKLNISENCIGDWGAKYLVEAVQVNTTLLELDISKTEMGRGGVMKILEACTNERTLQKLLCTHNKLIESDVADINEYVKTNNAVQIFDISWNNVIAKYESEMDVQRYFVITVKFQSTQLVDENKCSKEIELWLVDDNYRKWHNNNIKYSVMHDAVTELKFLPSIKSSLILRHCIQAVLQIDTLEKFDISDNKISDNQVIRFSECLKTKGTLLELCMSGNDISCKGANAIAGAMHINTVMQKLDISKNKVSDDGAIALSKCLKTNTTLIDLDVSNNSISCKGVSAIAESMRVNSAALQKLNISNCMAGDDGAIAFSRCLKTNKKLIELKMSGNKITSKGLRVIAEAMEENNALQKLDISNNIVSDKGIIAFNKYLVRNLSLVELNISSNGITCQGANTIAEAMQMNNTLRRLDISNNEILDNGIKTFSGYLKTDPPLTELRMVQNGVTSDGTSSIVQGLQMNTTLQKLDISCNKISDDGAITLSKCLKNNATLTELNVSRDYFTCEGVKAIVEGIQANKGLRSLILCTGNMKASSYTCGHSFNMSVLTALYHNDTITELTLSMPFPLSHHTGLLNELEKINNKRKNGIDLVKFNYVDECN